MIGTIVVAVDGSEHSGRALTFAAEIARTHKAGIVLVHALLRTASTSELYAVAERLGFIDAVKADLKGVEAAAIQTADMGESVPVPIVPDELLKRIGELVLDKSKSAVGSAQAVKTQVSDDDPPDAIVRCAEKENADLVVIGSRGFGRVKGLILGSVSQKVLQDVPCACLLVK